MYQKFLISTCLLYVNHYKAKRRSDIWFIYFRYERVSLAYPEKPNEMTCEDYRTICQTTKSSHLHLKYLCQKTLQQNSFTLDPQEEEPETTRLILNIHNRKEGALEEFLITFIRRTQDPSVIQSMAKLLKLLVGDAPMPATVPFRYHKHLLETCSAVKNGRDVKNNLEIIKKYGVHLSNILKVSITHSFGVACARFLEYLVDKVQGIHSNDITEPQEKLCKELTTLKMV